MRLVLRVSAERPRSSRLFRPGVRRGTAARGQAAVMSTRYWRMLTARATTMIARRRLAADWTSISIFAQTVSGIVSVGLNAVALVKAT